MNDNEEFVEKNLKELCGLLLKSGDDEFIFDFFKCLFTDAELADFAKRWQIVKEIDAGKTQREIAKKYNMSLCKITRGSKILKTPGNAFRKMLGLLYGNSH